MTKARRTLHDGATRADARATSALDDATHGGGLAGGALPAFGRLLPASLAGLFLVLCLLRVHGFSLPIWHQIIDQSEQTEVLVGEARSIRADDWAASLPLTLSQLAQQPRFPVSNSLVGEGSVSNLVGFSVPLRHWLSLFRPHLWGYFFGPDFGLAWNWWFRALLLVYALHLVFMILSRGRSALSLAAAVAVVYAPFFQYWSLNYEPMTASMALCFVAAVGLVFAASRRAIVLFALLLFWAGGVFALGAIYPPYQIVFAYLLAFLFSGFLIRERARLRRLSDVRLRVLAGGVALAAVLGCLALYVFEAREVIPILAGTVYPAQRAAHGGDLSLPQLLNSLFTILADEPLQSSFGNICEGASFYFFFPVVLAFVGWQWAVRRRTPDPVVGAVSLCLLLLLAYALVGVPPWLARVTGLGLVPGPRTLPALGIAETTLLVAFLAGSEASPRPSDRGVALAASGVFALTLMGAGIALHALVPAISWTRILLVSASTSLLALLLLERRCSFLPALALISIASTLWFNPWVHAGTAYLRENPLSRVVLEQDRRAGGQSRWIVFDDPWLANLWRVIGVRALNGVHYYPQLALWARVDPTGEGRDVYNRYAHVEFWVSDRPGTLALSNPYPDRIQAVLFPSRAVLTALGADFVVCSKSSADVLRRIDGLHEIAEVGDRVVFRVDPVTNQRRSSHASDRGAKLAQTSSARKAGVASETQRDRTLRRVTIPRERNWRSNGTSMQMRRLDRAVECHGCRSPSSSSPSRSSSLRMPTTTTGTRASSGMTTIIS